ncbi:hypothetical protein [Amycolatopsis sp. 195334CR]|uniref:hypothetical protein n=1 Tax=Amycolatopsis sp. 195334CR TaxID=2814588 RepID=UPI001A8F5EE8|nr:hypothetical protein [Amycolatopsis sp. 195334CR]MBN6036647.1 hypothetical protein [Amycolatopsis sp. 195334CR]
MSARLEFGEVEPLLLPGVSAELPAVGEVPATRWEDPASYAVALRWWRSCRGCRAVSRSIFDALLHQRQCRTGRDPGWPVEDADDAR